jgi:hypothetical protein
MTIQSPKKKYGKRRPEEKYVTQSIRILAKDNLRMKRLAERRGMSFNSWLVEVLTAKLRPKKEAKNGTDV